MKLSSKLWCFVGVHEWKIIDQGPYRLTYVDSNESKNGKWFSLQCQSCGDVKMRRCV
jgi:hypothetical protein